MLVVLAFLLAAIAVVLLVATMFVDGGALVYTSCGAGLALAAFILVYVAYVKRAVK